ncbi:MAG: hypothetical protein EZS28_015347 [Streblomastix strix]|uniref:Uncharacterized protein n=1 Tax=Streblomastix strix TaxID=222440 RepID=A0A5J4W3I2_9EUKA|nr:MAG: hypothetical protein EZS28_015344 [Streblomastix strix]KAA6389129.1 MAG: hypothetical protein EZS28_015347 [Streblomastix strix]
MSGDSYDDFVGGDANADNCYPSPVGDIKKGGYIACEVTQTRYCQGEQIYTNYYGKLIVKMRYCVYLGLIRINSQGREQLVNPQGIE